MGYKHFNIFPYRRLIYHRIFDLTSSSHSIWPAVPKFYIITIFWPFSLNSTVSTFYAILFCFLLYVLQSFCQEFCFYYRKLIYCLTYFILILSLHVQALKIILKRYLCFDSHLFFIYLVILSRFYFYCFCKFIEIFFFPFIIPNAFAKFSVIFINNSSLSIFGFFIFFVFVLLSIFISSIYFSLEFVFLLIVFEKICFYSKLF